MCPGVLDAVKKTLNKQSASLAAASGSAPQPGDSVSFSQAKIAQTGIAKDKKALITAIKAAYEPKL